MEIILLIIVDNNFDNNYNNNQFLANFLFSGGSSDKLIIPLIFLCALLNAGPANPRNTGSNTRP